jgi:hypothetical protein
MCAIDKNLLRQLVRSVRAPAHCRVSGFHLFYAFSNGFFSTYQCRAESNLACTDQKLCLFRLFGHNMNRAVAE